MCFFCYTDSMRQPRLTYPGAYHHVTNRGIEGRSIFAGGEAKRFFVGLLREKSLKFRVRLFAYCIMDSHYHLVLQNASGRMSAFFRNLNSQFGFYFRKQNGGTGYVFQGRFHSTIIEDDSYLIRAILYVLNNPVRAALVDDFRDYKWSSGNKYFVNEASEWLDVRFVEQLFGHARTIRNALNESVQSELGEECTRFGGVLGADGFQARALQLYERRNHPDAVKRRRNDDYSFDPIEKVYWEFEKKNGLKVDDIDVTRWQGKRLRGELIVRLRDQGGLTFREIAELPIFSDLQYRSLPHLYWKAK
jgi:REP element-mobilizing transposase RayT